MTSPSWPLFGHLAALNEFAAARESGRLHHAWLLEGPSGIGKSILARHIAASMLGAASAPDTPLSASEDDPVVQKILADSHPDFHWLTRRQDERGKLRQDIPVDDIRALNVFFSLRPALGGWRIGVIDAMDDLNRSGANALLKTLEEPPANCLLLLINHRTQPVLPTIRSRCRTLRMNILSDDDTALAIETIDDSAMDQTAAKSLARGRPGVGLKLSTPDCMSAANAARDLFRSGSDPATAAFIKRAGSDMTTLQAGVSELLSQIETASEKQPDLARAWLSLSRIVGESRELNMDTSQTAAKLAQSLQMLMHAR